MITISAGHWTVGTGASGIIDEVTEARKVAKRVVQILQMYKIPVNYIEDNTSTKQSENLNYLVSQHNKTSRKLDVSVHFNSTSGGTQNRGIGTEVLYFSEKELATKLSQSISSASGLIDRGAKLRKDLSFLLNTSAPSVLLEICFVNSTVDVAIYRRDFEKICQNIANVLIAHVGKIETDVKPLEILNSTGRAELRQLLKKARNTKVIDPIHTDEKIQKYSDVELLSYTSAIINRTFK